MDFIFIYITNPTREEAKRVAKHLLEKKLIACANIFPVESLYWWEGKIAEENEVILVAKTTENKFEKINREVESIHPYKIPCVAKIPVALNEKYAIWLKENIK